MIVRSKVLSDAYCALNSLNTTSWQWLQMYSSSTKFWTFSFVIRMLWFSLVWFLVSEKSDFWFQWGIKFWHFILHACYCFQETEVLSQTRNGENVKMTITLTNELPPSSPVCLQFYNILFKRSAFQSHTHLCFFPPEIPSDACLICCLATGSWESSTCSRLDATTTVPVIHSASHNTGIFSIFFVVFVCGARWLEIEDKKQMKSINLYQHPPPTYSFFRLTIWPGFASNILQYESAIMLCTDVSHKVLRSETVLHFMGNLKQQVGDARFRDVCTKELVGLIVLTK